MKNMNSRPVLSKSFLVGLIVYLIVVIYIILFNAILTLNDV